MDREFHIFECLPDGSFRWRDSVVGLENARMKLQAFSQTTSNDHIAMHLPTREVIFQADRGRKGPVIAKRVFQIAYTEELRLKRAEALRSRGYGVVSVIGNDSAKLFLNSARLDGDIDYFIVGHAAPEQTRKEMVDWLKAKYPKAKILALNPPNQQIPSADYNVLQNGPETWLPLFATADA